MARLHKRADGGYYIRKAYPGVGVSTYQVTSEGVSFLATHGVSIDGEGEVPAWLLTELKRHEFAFTHGRGLDAIHQSLATQKSAAIPLDLQLTPSSAVDGWSLSMVLGDLPSDFLRSIPSRESPIALLSQCRLRIRGSELSGIGLLPGKGGVALPVPPAEQSYVIELVGPWPNSWNLNNLRDGVAGLRKPGTIFHTIDEGGSRLDEGEPMALHTAYCLVRSREESLPPFPANVRNRSLGMLQGWEAWEVSLPDSPDVEIESWCHRLGHPLGVRPWTLTLVSPLPSSYDEFNVPVVPTGEVLIAVRSPGSCRIPEGTVLTIDHNNHSEGRVVVTPLDVTEADAAYVTFPTDPGMYCIRGAYDEVRSLKFSVAPVLTEELSPTEVPAPLCASIQLGDQRLECTGYSGKVATRSYEISSTQWASPIEVEVSCPVAVSIDWTLNGRAARMECISSDEAGRCLSKELSKALPELLSLSFDIDAGSFGFVAVHFEFVPPTHQGQRMSFMARWIETLSLIHSVDGESTETPIPRQWREVLRRLPEGSGLARHSFVPAYLMPYIKSLAVAYSTCPASSLEECPTGSAERRSE